MTPHHATLKRAIDARVSEPRIRDLWHEVHGRLRSAERGHGSRRWIVAVAIAGVAVVALVSVPPSPSPPAFLALADGSAPTAMRAETTTTIAFADASTLTLEAGASIVPTRNDATRFDLTLDRGPVAFSVTPHGPRRWTIDCGLATVVVVGTEFVIERTPDEVRVAVTRGVVHVEHGGESHALTAGEALVVSAPSSGEGRVAVSPPPPAHPPHTVDAVTPPHPAHAPRWQELATEGDYDAAYRALGPRGAAGLVAATDPADLLALADVARLSGHPEDAVAPLDRLMARDDDTDAALGAIVLARMEQDVLAHPDRAVRALDRAFSLGVPESLEIDLRSRYALALLDAGDARGPDVARAYLEAHPEGARVALLRARIE